MESALDLDIQAQPDDRTCGPTCLHAVYAWHGLHLSLAEVIGSVPRLEGGGTLAVLLGVDALSRGFEATLLTWNLEVFDPTWFGRPGVDLAERLRREREAKAGDPRLVRMVDGCLAFLAGGGEIRFEDLTGGVLRRYLRARVPVLTGLSATYLYRSPREVEDGERLRYDDVHGVPQGHFVVLCGYDPDGHQVRVADPLRPNPLGAPPRYAVALERLVGAILLGSVTYDANLLVLRPRARLPARTPCAS